MLVLVYAACVLLVVGVAAVADAMSAGRLTAKALAWFAGLLAGAIVLTFLVYEAVLAAWPVDAESARLLVAGATAKLHKA